LHVYTYICVVKLEEALKTTKFKSPQQKAMLNCLYTAWWLKTLLSRELKKSDLTHEQYNVLRILKGKYPDQMCVRDIASRMMEKSSNVPRIVDRLVAKRWVKRTTSNVDKRETVINLTQGGIDVLEVSTTQLDQLVNRLLTLGNSEAIQLNELLEKLREREE
jgi:DNA-binding MarR family transcriptional regulator